MVSPSGGGGWSPTPARAHRTGRSGSPRVRRAWRERGRKAQVSAVATILGLLLVVTFIANYLSTTLPGVMIQNDVSHDLVIEDDAGSLQALLMAASAHHVIGTEVTQPFPLGSVGAPPFAPQDGSQIGPVRNGTYELTTFALGGSSTGKIRQLGGGGFVVQLENTYAPQVQVAYDEGGIVFAQRGGIPVLVDPPPISIAGTTLTIWMPSFTDTIGYEGGISTAVLTATLQSYVTETFPAGGVTVGGDSVTVTVRTPYSSAWMAWLDSAASGFAGDATCVAATASLCSPTGTYLFNGGFGLVTITIPADEVILEIASFSIALS